MLDFNFYVKHFIYR